MTNCSICNRFLDNSADYLSENCGGDCLGCIRVAEGKYAYIHCDHHDGICTVPVWTLEFFEQFGQRIRLNDGKITDMCVEHLANGWMSALIQGGRVVGETGENNIARLNLPE